MFSTAKDFSTLNVLYPKTFNIRGTMILKPLALLHKILWRTGILSFIVSDVFATPFVISSGDSFFWTQVDIAGQYKITDDAVTINVSHIHIYHREHTNYTNTRKIKSINFALAGYTANGQWHQFEVAEPFSTNEISVKGDHHFYKNLTFSIPKDPKLNLQDRWLLFVVTATDGDQEHGGVGYTYAHSDKKIFTKHYSPNESEPQGCPKRPETTNSVNEQNMPQYIQLGNLILLE